ncbi:ThiJ/PfpI domain-containing protein [Lysobacter dokdonensis DS-58]|uniref:ThiJ/PfpI domain-containing protein n=1 Tax=Lysobacter dokdonensis DS-58 TaxID=1300345 RepID=A0A0A2WKG9_9GAMM|nr:DJ-1/PfpI family protein [Lysobacter dokdonensis]KGQ18760.1 ThiJ/PfpI domain-containing protein [Lysobacter dokdonensis DS-58]
MPRHVFGTLALSVLLGVSPQASPSRDVEPHFAPWSAQHGHARPVVAVIGHNAGTELTDFVIPYAVLQRSGAVDTFAVSTSPGPMQMRPAKMRLQPDLDVVGFDRRFPEGADYVVVPAIVQSKDAALLAWIRAQHAKGATIVSICDGALVVANTGLLKGHRATAHWATEGHRRDAYPDTDWVANTRYVIDGTMASSAGISASIPMSLALLESIAGRDRAESVGAQFGVERWSSKHDSDAFHLRTGTLGPFVKVNAANKWFHGTQRLGLPLQAGIDDVSLALTADAYSRTGRSVAYGFAAGEVRGRSGLTWLPETAAVPDARHRIDAIPAAPGVPLFDAVLASIDGRYGRTTAKGVALDFEYPWVPAQR